MKHIYLRSILFICIITSLNPGLFAQDIQNERIGAVSDFIKKLRTLDVDQTKLRRKGNFKLDKEGKLIADIKRFSNDQSLEIYSGKVNGEKNSNVVLEVKDNKVTGTITLLDTKKSFKYNTDATGEIMLTEVDINKVICIDYDKSPAKKSKRAATATSESIMVTALHSNINAPTLIYLDFDGEVVNSP